MNLSTKSEEDLNSLLNVIVSETLSVIERTGMSYREALRQVLGERMEEKEWEYTKN